MKEAADGMNFRESGITMATDKPDQLGMVMKYLRAAERHALSEISVCLMRYPKIHELVDNPYALEGNLSLKLRRLKDHGIELARDVALEQVQQGQEVAEEQDAWITSRRRKKKALGYCINSLLDLPLPLVPSWIPEAG